MFRRHGYVVSFVEHLIPHPHLHAPNWAKPSISSESGRKPQHPNPQPPKSTRSSSLRGFHAPRVAAAADHPPIQSRRDLPAGLAGGKYVIHPLLPSCGEQSRRDRRPATAWSPPAPLHCLMAYGVATAVEHDLRGRHWRRCNTLGARRRWDNKGGAWRLGTDVEKGGGEIPMGGSGPQRDGALRRN
jgi:hypothetical protein